MGETFVPLLQGGRLDVERPVLSFRLSFRSTRYGSWVSAIVRDEFKLIRTDADGGPRFELYDLSKDPSENDDLALARPGLVHELSTILQGTFDTAPRYPPSLAPQRAIPDEMREALRALGYAR